MHAQLDSKKVERLSGPPKRRLKSLSDVDSSLIQPTGILKKMK